MLCSYETGDLLSKLISSLANISIILAIERFSALGAHQEIEII